MDISSDKLYGHIQKEYKVQRSNQWCPGWAIGFPNEIYISGSWSCLFDNRSLPYVMVSVKGLHVSMQILAYFSEFDIS